LALASQISKELREKIMKKILILTLVMIMATLALTACGNGDNNDTNQDVSTQNNDTQEITTNDQTINNVEIVEERNGANSFREPQNDKERFAMDAINMFSYISSYGSFEIYSLDNADELFEQMLAYVQIEALENEAVDGRSTEDLFNLISRVSFYSYDEINESMRFQIGPFLDTGTSLGIIENVEGLFNEVWLEQDYFDTRIFDDLVAVYHSPSGEIDDRNSNITFVRVSEINGQLSLIPFDPNVSIIGANRTAREVLAEALDVYLTSFSEITADPLQFRVPNELEIIYNNDFRLANNQMGQNVDTYLIYGTRYGMFSPISIFLGNHIGELSGYIMADTTSVGTGGGDNWFASTTRGISFNIMDLAITMPEFKILENEIMTRTEELVDLFYTFLDNDDREGFHTIAIDEERFGSGGNVSSSYRGRFDEYQRSGESLHGALREITITDIEIIRPDSVRITFNQYLTIAASGNQFFANDMQLVLEYTGNNWYIVNMSNDMFGFRNDVWSEVS